MLFRDSHRLTEPRSVPFVLSTQAINMPGAPAAAGTDGPSTGQG
jgi:hypothetical protein